MIEPINPWRQTWTLTSTNEEPPVNNEPDFGRELTGDEIPHHLRHNASAIGQCNRCMRFTWSPAELHTEDRMTQPDGNPCGGRIVRLDDWAARQPNLDLIRAEREAIERGRNRPT